MRLVTLDDIATARELISNVGGFVRTPLVPVTDADPARPLWLKPENLQPVGAFKIRGALNAAASLTEAERDRGLVAYSSGNHALALAYAARVYGVAATVVVPRMAPAAKVEAARALGAEIIEVEVAERESRAHSIAEGRGATLVPPFDDPAVIAGQGTVGLEIAEDIDPAVVLVPISGGGLISGIGVAITALRPNAKVIGVEPELAADAHESLHAGRRRTWPVDLRTRTIADGLTAEPSELTWAHITSVVDDIVTVSESEIAEAVRCIARQSRLIAEPSGAVTTAAYRHRALPAGDTVAVVSGGNINPADLAGLLAD